MRPRQPRSARTPRTLVYRLGRLPDPLEWPPLESAGSGRFDDPARRFRVLYAARQRAACFAETLATFRPSLELLAETGDPADIVGAVSAGFLRSRGVAAFHLRAGRWLDDVRCPACPTWFVPSCAPTRVFARLPPSAVAIAAVRTKEATAHYLRALW